MIASLFGYTNFVECYICKFMSIDVCALLVYLQSIDPLQHTYWLVPWFEVFILWSEQWFVTHDDLLLLGMNGLGSK